MQLQFTTSARTVAEFREELLRYLATCIEDAEGRARRSPTVKQSDAQMAIANEIHKIRNFYKELKIVPLPPQQREATDDLESPV